MLLLFVLGTGGLILDFGRVWNSQSELQAFADHAALVAAGELDGTPDAITRSNAALAQLISDRQAYASQDVTLDANDLQATFLGLPAADTDNDFSPFVTADPALAQYVRVVVNPHTVSTIFANALLAVSGNAQIDLNVQAAAVAGYTQFVCDITPLMFCPPAGMDRDTLRSWLPGRQIRLKAQNFWGPGAFGLLDVNFDPNGPCGNPNQGANFFRCAVGGALDHRCFSRRGVDVRPGQAAGPSESGLNTRFDIYSTSLQSKRNDPDFAPAPNVIKGYKPNGGGSCIGNNPTPSNVAELPQASCLLDGLLRPEPALLDLANGRRGRGRPTSSTTTPTSAWRTGPAAPPPATRCTRTRSPTRAATSWTPQPASRRAGGRCAPATCRPIRTGACWWPRRSIAARCRRATRRTCR